MFPRENLSGLFLHNSFTLLFFIKERSEVYHKQKYVSHPHRQVFYKGALADGYEQHKHKRKYCGENHGSRHIFFVLLSELVNKENDNSRRTEESENQRR